MRVRGPSASPSLSVFAAAPHPDPLPAKERGEGDERSRAAESSARVPVARDLRGQELPRRLDVDQRIDLEFRRDDIGPFVEDAMKLLMAFDLKGRSRAAADARIDVPADAFGLVLGDPGPKALPVRRLLGRALRS